MSRTIAGEYFPEDSYPAQWTIFWIIALAGAIALWICAHRPPPFAPPPIAAPSAGMDRFLMLWLPETPANPEQTQGMRARYAQWLHALSDNGYHPLLLSDVLRRFRKGVGLPDHAVVIVFDPGYRHTFETAAPIFRRYRVPAVWMINQTDLRRDQRRTLNGHTTQAMQESDYWDVGFHDVRDDWKFSPTNSEVIHMRNLTTRWAPEAGNTALNTGTDLSILNGLHVAPSWSAADLVTRMRTEWPLQSRAWLTVKPVEHYLWGVVADETEGAHAFNLHAPLTQSSASLFWLGTIGCRDFELTADIQQLFGEAFFWLRSSRDKKEGFGVGLGHQVLFVDRTRAGVRQRLAAIPISLADQRSSHLIMRLDGDTLTVFFQGRSVIRLPHAAPSIKPSLIRLTIYDKIRGAATLDMRQLQITPLTATASTA